MRRSRSRLVSMVAAALTGGSTDKTHVESLDDGARADKSTAAANTRQLASRNGRKERSAPGDDQAARRLTKIPTQEKRQ